MAFVVIAGTAGLLATQLFNPCGNRMDEWCAAAMVRQCVLVALANSVASVCRIRACSLPYVFRAVSQHKAQDSGKSKVETWVFVVTAGTAGLLATLLFNLGARIWLSSSATSPALPQMLAQRFLVLAAWGFMVPFIWGFSAKWLPIFLGTRQPDRRLLLWTVAGYAMAILLGLQLCSASRPR